MATTVLRKMLLGNNDGGIYSFECCFSILGTQLQRTNVGGPCLGSCGQRMRSTLVVCSTERRQERVCLYFLHGGEKILGWKSFRKDFREATYRDASKYSRF